MKRKNQQASHDLFTLALLLCLTAGALGCLAGTAYGLKLSPWQAVPIISMCMGIQVLLQMRFDLLQHEAAHYLLLQQRRFNDFFGQWICSVPLLNDLGSYRSFHFAHHRHVGDLTQDPEVPYYAKQGYHYKPLPTPVLLRKFVLDLSGYHFLQFTMASWIDEFKVQPRQAATALIKVLFVQGLLIAIFGWQAYALGWLVPMATVKFFLQKLQAFAEHVHYHGPQDEHFHLVENSWFERLLVFPLNAHLHTVHHKYPGLAWYRLPEALATLRTKHQPVAVPGVSGLWDLLRQRS